jgi:hypothetical protein
MRSVQVSKPKAHVKYVSRYKHAVYAIVIPLLKKDYSRAYNIQGFLATRLQEL